jgi:hypothetical protein
MATRTVLLHFSANKIDWTHKHEVLVEILQASTSQTWVRAFKETMEGITSKHELNAPIKCGRTCIGCQQPISVYSLHPISWLHRVNEPFLHIEVIPLCGKTKCERDAAIYAVEVCRQHGMPSMLDRKSCIVCGQQEDLMRCVRCKEVMYCGR